MFSLFVNKLSIFFGILFVLILTNNISAQQSANTYVYANISYDTATNTVNASMNALPDYSNYSYFQSGVSASIYDGMGNALESKSIQTSSSSPIVNFQKPGNGCGNYKIAGGGWMSATYYVYQMYGWDGQYHTGYYKPYNYFDTSGGVPSVSYFYRQGNGPVTWSY